MKKSVTTITENILIPIVLMLLPLRHVAEGIDISDTGYSLGCFAWFGKLPGAVWVYVTYLSNIVGNLFTRLPGGDTWLGMNVYCSLVVSLIAVTSYFFLKGRIHPVLLTLGEVLAICLCWCPHIILYNYLTYLVLLIGTILLFCGIPSHRKGHLLLAGMILGLGVGVRFSNLTHMALIVALWYYAFLKKVPVKKVIADTLFCIAGYVIGLLLFAASVYGIYRFENYGEMLSTLTTMGASGAGGYGLADMLLDAWKDYAEGLRWGALYIAYAGLGFLFWKVFLPRLASSRKGQKVWSGVALILYIAGFGLLTRFTYGRGMFGLDYNEFFAYFKWAGFFAVLAIAGCLLVIVRKGESDENKLLASLILLTILILPLGSNNHAHPVYNDLFLIAPFTLEIWRRYLPKSIPVRTTAILCLLVFSVQCVLFGATYVFRDGTQGIKRDTKVTGSVILNGMHTDAAHAKNLSEICTYASDHNWTGREVILYGDIPGLSYVLSMPSATTTTYANLDSYNMGLWERDFGRVEEKIAAAPKDDLSYPIVMIGTAYEPKDNKKELLLAFTGRHGYTKVFENAEFTAYERMTR
ncbi:MAG: hypothetical protein E7300_09370 [Lachnospiraceae bacterium]|nr:hypothetical protein [Lachnospiraceae bacterium]